ncbi:LuxR C-terminal-related transcriptional regulator [Microvirga sesbaniae]|uniref:LuxR C-terminal-related transcriptional regulator n=1 Tax=Microvirga sesbaniae TaxID=681392 RepID=UPI0021C7079A|nr:response regulator transcription factor [Microvirga sp. HBU67692]
MIASNALPCTTTLLICRNIVLRAGLRLVLSDTPFALSDHAIDPASDMLAFAESDRILILLGETLTLDAYLETLERLKAQCPAAWVVVLADHLEPNAVLRLLQAGLNGLCSPAMGGSSLVKVLELVTDGETFLPAEIGMALLERQSHWSGLDAQNSPVLPAVGLAGRLSDREAQILRCLTQGASNKMIARQLGIAEPTVKVHIKSILRKVKAGNRTQAAMWAQHHLQLPA